MLRGNRILVTRGVISTALLENRPVRRNLRRV